MDNCLVVWKINKWVPNDTKKLYQRSLNCHGILSTYATFSFIIFFDGMLRIAMSRFCYKRLNKNEISEFKLAYNFKI